jgi:hypothetical protein
MWVRLWGVGRRPPTPPSPLPSVAFKPFEKIEQIILLTKTHKVYKPWQMYSSRTLLCKTCIPRPTPRMKTPGLHIRGLRFVLPQPESLMILGLCFYGMFSYFPGSKTVYSYECFVGDILWTLNVGDILWTLNVGDILWTLNVGDIVWQYIIHDIYEHWIKNVAVLISQYWLILYTLLSLTPSREILYMPIMAQFKAETCSCRFSLTNISFFLRIFIGSYIIRTTKYVVSKYSPKILSNAYVFLFMFPWFVTCALNKCNLFA